MRPVRSTGAGRRTPEQPGPQGVPQTVHSATSVQLGPQNRLDNVADPATGGMDGQSAGNYAYDEIGNLVKDETEEIAEIKWTVYGKVRAVVREAGSTKPDLDFAYTASGQRYLKVVKPKNPDGSLKNSGFWTFTYYQHDAQGNVLAVYDIKNADEECGYEMYLDQLVLYGSSRLGVLNQKLKMGTMEHSFPGYGGPLGMMHICLGEAPGNIDILAGAVPATSPGEIFVQSSGGKIESSKPWELVQNPASMVPISIVGEMHANINQIKPAKEVLKYEPGHKQYEFSNHLGNVLVTVSDLPLGVDVGSDGNVDYYMPDVKTTSDYEPFGAPLEGRTLSENGGYDFAFNVPMAIGKMKDDELHGEGNTYAFEYRIHDARIGRFLSVDPLAISFPWNSTYAFAENRVIDCIDAEGLELLRYDESFFVFKYNFMNSTTEAVIKNNTYVQQKVALAQKLTFAEHMAGKPSDWLPEQGITLTFTTIGSKDANKPAAFHYRKPTGVVQEEISITNSTKGDGLGVLISDAPYVSFYLAPDYYQNLANAKHQMAASYNAVYTSARIVNGASSMGMIPPELDNDLSKTHLMNYVMDGTLPEISTGGNLYLYRKLIIEFGTSLFENRERILSGESYDVLKTIERIPMVQGDWAQRNNIKDVYQFVTNLIAEAYDAYKKSIPKSKGPSKIGSRN